MRRPRAGRVVLPGLLGLGLLGLAACGGGGAPVEDEAEIANPASVHCEEQGGTVEIVETDDGQVGICVFDDGRECEEWAYYRQGVCIPAADQAMTTVELYFSNETLGDPCGEVFPVPRQVPADTPPVEAVAALLDRTLLQFPGIDATIYAIDGSPEIFYEWLQHETPAG
jgi:putative hemolysin